MRWLRPITFRLRPIMRRFLRRTKPWLPGVLTAVGAIAGLALYAIVLGRIFDHYVRPADDKARKDLLVTLGTFLAGTLALLGVFPAWRTLRINQEGQITTRYTQAVGQLGNEKREVRLGGIYALERIARDSEKDYQQIIEVLVAYIRENAPAKPERLSASRKGKPKVPPESSPDILYGRRYDDIDVRVRPKEDIQAAINVLKRRRHKSGEGEAFALDLRWTNLRGADLRGIHLEKAEIWEASLRGADLRGANLQGAVLTNADLTGAHLQGASLQGADLTVAYLTGAYLTDADLTGAYLTDAYLTDADLTGAFLQGAYLTRADLTRANLRGADLYEAVLYEAVLTDAYLRQLDLARIWSPFVVISRHARDAQNLTWEQVLQVTISKDGTVRWRDGVGDRDALKSILPDYLVIPDAPDEPDPLHSPNRPAPEHLS